MVSLMVVMALTSATATRTVKSRKSRNRLRRRFIKLIVGGILSRDVKDSRWVVGQSARLNYLKSARAKYHALAVTGRALRFGARGGWFGFRVGRPEVPVDHGKISSIPCLELPIADMGECGPPAFAPLPHQEYRQFWP